MKTTKQPSVQPVIDMLRDAGLVVHTDYYRPRIARVKGGRTTILIGLPDGDCVRGEAMCSQKDQFSRPLGRRIALGRALAQAITKPGYEDYRTLYTEAKNLLDSSRLRRYREEQTEAALHDIDQAIHSHDFDTARTLIARLTKSVGENHPSVTRCALLLSLMDDDLA